MSFQNIQFCWGALRTHPNAPKSDQDIPPSPIGRGVGGVTAPYSGRSRYPFGSHERVRVYKVTIRKENTSWN